MRLSGDYLIFDLGYQYVEIANNNATHIYSVEIHVGMVDMHTLWPWP